MPIQVIYSNKQHLHGNVRANAGEDSVFTCRSVVTMTADIFGDPRGHTFQWEQISGEPVEFLSALDQPEMMFTFDVKEDKQFRFWIDKGTRLEQYDDVWAWQTPTEQHYVRSLLPKSTHWARPLDSTAQTNSAVHQMIEFTDFETALNLGYASATDTNKALYWTYPSDAQHITHHVVQRWENGQWTDYLLLGPEVNYTTIENGYNYRVVTFILDPLRYGSKYYPVISKTLRVDHEPIPFAESLGITGNTFVAKNTLESTGYSLLERWLKRYETDVSPASNSFSYVSNDSHLNTGYSVLQRVVFKFTPPDSEASNTNSRVTAAGHELTAFNVLDLINIEIGGELDVITIGG